MLVSVPGTRLSISIGYSNSLMSGYCHVLKSLYNVFQSHGLAMRYSGTIQATSAFEITERGAKERKE
jgi:hypothetical protein